MSLPGNMGRVMDLRQSTGEVNYQIRRAHVMEISFKFVMAPGSYFVLEYFCGCFPCLSLFAVCVLALLSVPGSHQCVTV